MEQETLSLSKWYADSFYSFAALYAKAIESYKHLIDNTLMMNAIVMGNVEKKNEGLFKDAEAAYRSSVTAFPKIGKIV